MLPDIKRDSEDDSALQDRSKPPSNHTAKQAQIASITKLPDEILRPVFQHLSIPDMIKARRIGKQFINTIDQNQTLWRHFNLKLGERQWWNEEGLKQFDERSQSTIVEFSAEVGYIRQLQFFDLMKMLLKSKETLETISFYLRRTTIYEGNKPIEIVGTSDEFYRFPKLKTFIMSTDNCAGSVPKTKLKKSSREIAGSEKGGGLEVLWLVSDPPVLFEHLDLLSNLKSFASEGVYNTFDLRKILEGCSTTLKHLRIAPQQQDTTPPPLNFPNLEVLELSNDGWIADCSWIICPSTTLVIVDYPDLPLGLPSVRELRLGGLGDWEEMLVNVCPKLQTLTVASKEWKPEQYPKEISDFLIQRKKNVEVEVNGGKMVGLKTLIIDFEKYDKSWIEEVLMPLVEEVVDVKEVSDVVEVEI